MTTLRIAIVDDEASVGKHLQRALAKEGHVVKCFLSAYPFLEEMSRNPFDLIFVDLRLPDLGGIEILTRIKDHHPDAEVIVITGYGSIDTAIEAIKKGAYHYVTKPIKVEEIRSLAAKVQEKIQLHRENRELRNALMKEDLISGFIGKSKLMQEVFAMIKKIAPVDCNILLQGESGTGKELAARAIHTLSPRNNHPFMSFNCAGFAEDLICNELFGHERGAFTGAVATKIGLFETASGGTVFLDEIGEMSLSTQVKLLHVIQERRILRVGGTKPIALDIRVIAASNKDIKQAVAAGSFREDLFYRLNVVTVHLPRLADRKDDLPLLIAYFLEKYCRAFNKKIRRVGPQALDILLSYGFPGNVRELENIIERAVALSEGEMIQVRDLPPDLQQLEFSMLEGESLLSLDEIEKLHIAKVLTKAGQNKGLAAKILNLPRTTLWRKMKKFGLANEGRDSS